MFQRLAARVASESLSGASGWRAITVPAYFDECIGDAALAGLQCTRLLNEPTAAAIAAISDSGKEGVIAVYDPAAVRTFR